MAATIMTVSGSVSLEPFSSSHAKVIAGMTSGCTLTAGMAVYVDGNGELQPTSTLIQSGSQTLFDGIVAKSAADGDYGLTVWGVGARFNYSTGMTPGTLLYVTGSGTGSYEGKLSDTPKVFAGPAASGSIVDLPVAKAISATDIVVIR